MSSITVPEVTKELRRAVELYIAARGYVEKIRPVIEKIHSDVLAENDFYIDSEWLESGRREQHAIRSESEADMMSEGDFLTYVQLTHAKYVAAGFDVELDYNPLSMAENDQRDAERLIIDAAEYITGLTSDRVWRIADRKKYVDLAVGFVLTSCPDITGRSILDGILSK